MTARCRINALKGAAKKLARSNARFDRIVMHSEDGSTKAEAATDIGITAKGVNAILKRKGLPTRWPINPEDLK